MLGEKATHGFTFNYSGFHAAFRSPSSLWRSLGSCLNEKQVQPTNLPNLASFIHHMLLSLFYKILLHKIRLEQSTPQMKIQ